MSTATSNARGNAHSMLGAKHATNATYERNVRVQDSDENSCVSYPAGPVENPENASAEEQQTDDWMTLIDAEAAMREQFPSLRAIRNERPGSATDRARQERYRIENHVSWERAAQIDPVADADRFIALMTKKRREAFAAAFYAATTNITERRTA